MYHAFLFVDLGVNAFLLLSADLVDFGNEIIHHVF